jgi:hypothetical protein
MISVANVVFATATFADYFLKVNECAAILSSQTITANNNANGAQNSGNAYLSGTFSANIGAFKSIRGGNVQSSNTLLVTSNVAVGNSYLSVQVVATSNADANQVMDSYNIATHRSSKFVIQVSNTTAFQATEILLTHDGANVYMTEYATLSTNGILGTFGANISSNSLNLLFSPIGAVNTVKFERRSLAV